MESRRRIEDSLCLASSEDFDAFFERYFDPIFAFAARSSSDAHDRRVRCERMFERVLSELPRRDPRVSLDAFVFAVARRDLAEEATRARAALAQASAVTRETA